MKNNTYQVTIKENGKIVEKFNTDYLACVWQDISKATVQERLSADDNLTMLACVYAGLLNLAKKYESDLPQKYIDLAKIAVNTDIVQVIDQLGKSIKE